VFYRNRGDEGNRPDSYQELSTLPITIYRLGH
jgi:hypothetical protein